MFIQQFPLLEVEAHLNNGLEDLASRLGIRCLSTQSANRVTGMADQGREGILTSLVCFSREIRLSSASCTCPFCRESGDLMYSNPYIHIYYTEHTVRKTLAKGVLCQTV